MRREVEVVYNEKVQLVNSERANVIGLQILRGTSRSSTLRKVWSVFMIHSSMYKGFYTTMMRSVASRSCSHIKASLGYTASSAQHQRLSKNTAGRRCLVNETLRDYMYSTMFSLLLPCTRGIDAFLPQPKIANTDGCSSMALVRC